MKATEFASKLDKDFVPCATWLWRWRKRNGIKYGKVHGEIVDNDSSSAQFFRENVLPDILKEFPMEDVFNADETGLFYKALPNTSFFSHGQERVGGKTQKVRLTVLLMCNGTGTYKKAFVIGKPSNPRCFKKAALPLPYFANKKAWMTSSIWEKIIIDLEKDMQKQNRKIVLFIDNAACHKISENVHLKYVTIKMLPPNTTALIQPLDQGIIKAFKNKYRHIIVQKQVAAVEREKTVQEFLKSVTILDAIYYVRRSWDQINEQTIANCFRKAGFLNMNNGEDVADDDSEINNSDDDCDEGVEIETFDTEYLMCDSEVPCYGELKDEEIIQELMNVALDDSTSAGQEEEDEDEIIENPNVKDVLSALDILQRYTIYNDIGKNNFFELETKVILNTLKNKKQTKITEYFK